MGGAGEAESGLSCSSPRCDVVTARGDEIFKVCVGKGCKEGRGG